MKVTPKVSKCYVNGGEVNPEKATSKWVGGVERTLRKAGVLPDTWRDPDDKPAAPTRVPVRATPSGDNQPRKSAREERIDSIIDEAEGNIKPR